MVRILMFVLLGTAAAAGAAAGGAGVPRLSVGDRMPALKGDLLSGKPAVLPDIAAGQTALVALGFSYDSRFQVEAWAKAFRARFGGRPDVTLFEVPMMGSAARLGRWFIDNGMRKNTPPELHGRVMTVYGSNADWKTRVGFAAPDAAYLVLIDGQGIVRWLAQGPVSDTRVEELAGIVDSLSRSVPDEDVASPTGGLGRRLSR